METFASEISRVSNAAREKAALGITRWHKPYIPNIFTFIFQFKELLSLDKLVGADNPSRRGFVWSKLSYAVTRIHAIHSIISVAISIDPPRTCQMRPRRVPRRDERWVRKLEPGIHCSPRIWFCVRVTMCLSLSLPCSRHGIVCFYCRCRFVRSTSRLDETRIKCIYISGSQVWT